MTFFDIRKKWQPWDMAYFPYMYENITFPLKPLSQIEKNFKGKIFEVPLLLEESYSKAKLWLL